MRKILFVTLFGAMSLMLTGCFESKSEETIVLTIDTSSVLKGRAIESTIKIDNDTNSVIVQK